VLNPIFGPRTFNAQKKEIAHSSFAEIQPQPAAFDVAHARCSIYPAFA